MVPDWCYPTTLGVSDRTIAAKWESVGNQRSWILRWQTAFGADAFQFITNDNGLVGNNVYISSSYAETLDAWHFVAGYYKASTIQKVYVAQSTDGALTIDQLTTGVPASLLSGTADLTIGATTTPSDYFAGSLGVGLERANVPSTNIDSHVTRLFQATRWFYGG